MNWHCTLRNFGIKKMKIGVSATVRVKIFFLVQNLTCLTIEAGSMAKGDKLAVSSA